uniref:Uncharacterized protein n=1 Tax=Panagrolaimus sp. PS1159 TaxID=55785 RepID=A0AC35FRC1_9BILA
MFSRQLLTICSVAIVATLIAASCVDRKDNLVDIGDETEGAYNAHFQNAVGATYDNTDTPSCYKSEPNLKLPGVLKLVSGSLTVKNAMNLVGNTFVLLTLTKDSFLIGKVCDHGKSKNPLIPDDDCKFAFCQNATNLCTALGTPGVHSLGEIEGDLGINGTIELPELSSAIKGILKGKWQAELDIQSSGNVVASIKIPTNEKWIDIDQ